MKILKFKAMAILLLAFSGPQVYSQLNADTSEYPYWIDMMQDPKANFFETQRAFEEYWEHRPITRGCGWKPFKRWESFMEIRVDSLGNKPLPGHNLEVWQAYKSGRDKSFSEAGGNGNWVELGPVNMPANGTGQPNGLGRINCIAFHPTNPNIIFVGAPSGGLWRTYNKGLQWETSTDSLPTLGVSSIVFNHANPSTVFIGTGDRDGSDAPGIGVMKSLDGGVTWALSNSGMGNRVVGRMIMHPTDTNILLAATSVGVYRSTDGGQSWSKRTPNSDHYKDIVFKPGSPNTVYATAYGDFFRSLDNGVTWTQITTGLASSTSRIVIGVSPANPNGVYCLGVDGSVYDGLWLSLNSGSSFVLQSDTPNVMDYSVDGSGTGGQGWYDLCIAVDPVNFNTVYVGGVNIFKSTDGGKNWQISAHWTGAAGSPEIHADQHELIFSSQNQLFSGNDGGIYYTSNGGTSWNDISSGLAIAQVYKLGQSSSISALTINGYQDNGTSVYKGIWSTEIGGDGMECIIDYTDSDYMYGALYYGDIRRSTNGGTNFSRIAEDGFNGITESGAWITPYLLDIVDPNTMYVGYKNIWRSFNVKTNDPKNVTWTQISNNLAGSNSVTIRVLEQSPVDPNIMYISRGDNKFFRSDNIQTSSPVYTDLSASLPSGTWPRDIEAHPFNANMVWIVQSNNVYQSSNKGVNWTNITGSLPNVSTNCIVYDESTGDLYVGTDLGVYLRKNGATDWISYNSGLPVSVEVTELEIYYDINRRNSRLKASTYGRGLWESELYESPNAEFGLANPLICVNQTVTFQDLSTGSYSSLLWSFPGGVPATSTDRFPQVYYPAAGVYPVQLEISNDIESDLAIKNSYINASPAQVFVTPDTSYINAGESVELTATGSTNYFWSPAGGLNATTGNKVTATPLVTTNYFVHGDNGVGCDTAMAVIFVHPVGNQELEEVKNISLFPNPASGKVAVDLTAAKGNEFDITIADIKGNLLQHQHIKLDGNDRVKQIDLTSLPAGIFFLHVKNDMEDAVFRLIHR